MSFPRGREERDARGEPDERIVPRGAAWFIAVVLAVQIIVPATYYLRDDPYDERFAWRMFSGIRMHRCHVAAYDDRGETRETIPLGRVMHVAWITLLRRNRRTVIEALLERRCEEPGVTSSRIESTCVDADGAPLPPLVYTRDCSTRRFRAARRETAR